MDVTELDIDEVARYLANFYEGGIDWDDALYRVEKVFDVDLPENITDPLITRIKKAYRAEVKARRD